MKMIACRTVYTAVAETVTVAGPELRLFGFRMRKVSRNRCKTTELNLQREEGCRAVKVLTDCLYERRPIAPSPFGLR